MLLHIFQRGNSLFHFLSPLLTPPTIFIHSQRASIFTFSPQNHFLCSLKKIHNLLHALCVYEKKSSRVLWMNLHFKCYKFKFCSLTFFLFTFGGHQKSYKIIHKWMSKNFIIIACHVFCRHHGTHKIKKIETMHIAFCVYIFANDKKQEENYFRACRQAEMK